MTKETDKAISELEASYVGRLDYARIMSEVEDDQPIDTAMEALLSQISLANAQGVDRFVTCMQDLKSGLERLKAEKKRITGWISSLEKGLAKASDVALGIMDADSERLGSEVKSIEGSTRKVSWRLNGGKESLQYPPGLVLGSSDKVLDEFAQRAVPPEYQKTVLVLDTDKIREHLGKGLIVKGFRLTRGRHVQYSTKALPTKG